MMETLQRSQDGGETTEETSRTSGGVQTGGFWFQLRVAVRQRQGEQMLSACVGPTVENCDTVGDLLRIQGNA